MFSGDEALARGAYEAGLSFAASYPGTPATEILEALVEYPEIDTQWSINEKVAYEIAYASALAGRRSMFSAKHVGLNVAMDSIMTSAYVGVNAGFVAVTADDPGLHSSQNEQDNRRIAQFAKMPLLEPASPAEAKNYIKYAFQLSEENDIPVLLRITTRIAHTKENMQLDQRTSLAQREYKIDVSKNVMVPAMATKRHKNLELRLKKLKALAENSELNREEINNPEIGFITSGVAYLYIKENYPEASVLKLGFTYPFPENKVREFAKKVKKLFVIEELEPILEDEVRKIGVSFVAKHESFKLGELRPEYIPLIVRGEAKPDLDKKVRPPSLCQECPHSYVFNILKDLAVVVTGDIGCYTLGALPPYNRLHTCLCMGASIPFLDAFNRAMPQKVVGVIGDSTFFHTGVAGLINTVYNRGKGLLLVLDNSTTAMTGSQPHPGTGFTARGEKTKKISIKEICLASQVDFVEEISPRQEDELRQLITKCLSANNFSVIIVKSACKLLKSYKKK